MFYHMLFRIIAQTNLKTDKHFLVWGCLSTLRFYAFGLDNRIGFLWLYSKAGIIVLNTRYSFFEKKPTSTLVRLKFEKLCGLTLK